MANRIQAAQNNVYNEQDLNQQRIKLEMREKLNSRKIARMDTRYL